MQIRSNGRYKYADDEMQDDIYDLGEIEILLEDDEISVDEEAFMQGYLQEEE